MVLDKRRWFSGFILGLFVLSLFMLNRQKQQPIDSGPEPLPHFRKNTLSLFTFGHRALVSDFLMARGLSYYGGHRTSLKEVSFSDLKNLFSLAFYLDPQNRELILLGTNLLVEKSLKDALSLLHEGMRFHPDYWKFPEMAGFLYYYYAKEPILAARFYERASRLPGHPPFVPSISSKLYEESGFFNQAIRVLRNLAQENNDERVQQSFEERIGEIEGRLRLRRFRVPVVLEAVDTPLRLQVRMKRFNPYGELNSNIVVDFSDTVIQFDDAEPWLLTLLWRMRIGQEIWIQLDTNESGRLVSVNGAWKGSWLGEGGEALLERALNDIRSRKTIGHGDALEGISGQFVRVCGHLSAIKEDKGNVVFVWKEPGLPSVMIAKEDVVSFSNHDWSRWIHEKSNQVVAVNSLLTMLERGVLFLPLIHPDQIQMCQE